jgi:hypothetical protein
MLKLYLQEQLARGEGQVSGEEVLEKQRGRFRRNRRLAERFRLPDGQLALMNEQDIFVVSELSRDGFRSVVSPEAADRFILGDQYKIKVRSRRDGVTLNAKVIWREQKEVGFRILNCEIKDQQIFASWLKPLEIGGSMHLSSEGNDQDLIFVGEGDTCLKVSCDTEKTIQNWQLTYEGRSINWSLTVGFRTGVLSNPHGDSLLLSQDKDVMWSYLDHDRPEEKWVQEALDIIFALADPIGEKILRGVNESAL